MTGEFEMATAKFVAGDWGTSHLRLFLCDDGGAVIDRVDGPGASRVCGAFEKALDSLMRAWTERHGELPIVLCGMVGSSNGWVQTPYVPCPAQPEQIATGCIRLRNGRIHIVPGLSCRNRVGSPDFMRGEETQVLGALELEPGLREGHHLLCLPGTHTKWVILEDGRVREFLTAPTGEVFASLCSQTTLVPDKGDVRSLDAFSRGLARIRQCPAVGLLHTLFECRSLRLSGELAPQETSSYLSGMLIASDVSGALGLLAATPTNPTVHIIGSSELNELYTLALRTREYEARALDGSAAAVAGLTRINQLRGS